MNDRPYRYLISYAYEHGHGSCAISVPAPITSDAEKYEVSKAIAWRNGWPEDSVTILDCQPLPTR